MGKEKSIGIDHIYVVHALRGYELHEKRLRTIMSELDFECQFITDGGQVIDWWHNNLID